MYMCVYDISATIIRHFVRMIFLADAMKRHYYKYYTVDVCVRFRVGNVGHRRWWRMQFRFAGQHRVRTPETAVAPKAEQTAVVRRQPGRELLLQLANGVDRLHPVQPVDGHRPAKPAWIATHGVRLVVGHGRVQRHRVSVRRSRPVPHGLPRTGPDGVQHQQIGRPLHPIPIVPVRSHSPHTTWLASAQNRRASYTPVSQIHQGKRWYTDLNNYCYYPHDFRYCYHYTSTRVMYYYIT